MPVLHIEIPYEIFHIPEGSEEVISNLVRQVHDELPIGSIPRSLEWYRDIQRRSTFFVITYDSPQRNFETGIRQQINGARGSGTINFFRVERQPPRITTFNLSNPSDETVQINPRIPWNSLDVDTLRAMQPYTEPTRPAVVPKNAEPEPPPKPEVPGKRRLRLRGP